MLSKFISFRKRAVSSSLWIQLILQRIFEKGYRPSGKSSQSSPKRQIQIQIGKIQLVKPTNSDSVPLAVWRTGYKLVKLPPARDWINQCFTTARSLLSISSSSYLFWTRAILCLALPLTDWVSSWCFGDFIDIIQAINENSCSKVVEFGNSYIRGGPLYQYCSFF